MNETTVVNVRRDAALVKEANAAGRYVYVGRPPAGKAWGFGNPFTGKGGTKAALVVNDPITAFLDWLTGEAYTDLMQKERRWILNRLHTLRGKVLGCYCKPAACHADVLKELADDPRVERWRIVSDTLLAIQIDPDLNLTEADLLFAIRTLPTWLRKRYGSFRWQRDEYREDGRRWGYVAVTVKENR